MNSPTLKKGLALGLIIMSGGISLFVLGIIGMYVAAKRFVHYLDSKRNQP